MKLPSSYDLSFTLGKTIHLCDQIGNSVPKKMIYQKIEQLVLLYGEQYQDAVIKGLFIRVYYDIKDSPQIIEFLMRYHQILLFILIKLWILKW